MSVNGSSDAPPGLSVALLLVVVLAPLPLGSNRPWAWSLLAVLIGLLLVWLFVWRLWQAGRVRPWPVWLPWLAVLWLAGAGWGGIQALPGLPAAWHHPVWAVAGQPDGRVAIDPFLAMDGAMRLLAWGGVFVLALSCGRRASRRLIRAVALAAGVYAAYGLVAHLGGSDTLLWWDKWAYPGVLTATFVNRNAAADMLGFGVLCSVVWWVRGRRDIGRRNTRGARPDLAVPLMLAGLCGLGVLLTQSRAGVVAAISGLIVLSIFIAVGRGQAWRAMIRGGVAAFVGTLALLAIGLGVADRLARTDLTDNDRTPVHVAVLVGIADRPWLGHGLGGFETAFMPYRPPSLPQRWDRAHSVFLETAFEMGLPAALALGASLIGIGALCVQGVMRRQRIEYPALGLAALTLAGLHGLWDFAPQVPANAVWLALVLGVAAGQSGQTRRAAHFSAAGSVASARR